MDLHIKGQKHLNSNRYQSIMIKSIKRNINKGLIDVRTNKAYSDTLVLSPPKFMDTIKDLTEIEKVKEIIEYFSRNNIICRMVEKNGVHVFSTSDRQLDIEMGFSSENQLFIRKTISGLIYNYLDNRLRFLEDYYSCKTFHIIGDSEQSGYEVYEDLGGSNETMWIHLLSEHNSSVLRDFEKKFLEDFIIERICKQGRTATIEDNWCVAKKEEYPYADANTLNIHNYAIFCGDIAFRFYNITINDLKDLTKKVQEYNENYREQEVMQLKLDLGGKV